MEEVNHPLASQVLQSSVYIDDCVSGADSVDASLRLQTELISLLKKRGFELRKWASNFPSILSAVPADYSQISFESEGPSFLKVLILQWDPKSDVFFFSYSPIETTCTKRKILSEIAKIFDP